MFHFIVGLSVLATCYSQVVITKFDENDGVVNNKQLYNDVVLEGNYNPDVDLTASQIIRRHGYQSESHVVETSDGYLLTVHRIPKNKIGQSGQQPVFIQHGLLSSSADFLITGDNKSLAFILSDLGYDVWLGNARGNTYSRGHVSLSTGSEEFWNFTFHEMAKFDLPSVLSYISNVTGKTGEIIYVGHSMGTTMFYAMASIMPDFAKEHVKLMVGLAPVAYMTHITSPIKYFAPFVNDIQWIAKHLGIKQFLPYGLLMKFLSYNCEQLHIERIICEQVIFVICGFDQYQFDMKLLPLVLGHAPAGTSTKTIIHFAQEIHYNGNFMQFDYGKEGNIVQYGNSTPPPYEISNIDVPTYFMYSDNDWLSNEIDVKRLFRGVKNSLGMYRIPYKLFNHVDFIWGKDAPELVYKQLIDIVQKYS
ncbi:hypothetical protein FQR65_LT02373 [Abscondita terminalis]|nr:hypothetical protein FQR65_LT02373 [Abscondita terminalis]